MPTKRNCRKRRASRARLSERTATWMTLCEGRKNRRGGVLCAVAGARFNGATGCAGRVPRRQSGGVGANARPARRAGRHRASAGVEKGRCDRARHAARRRLWPEVVSGLCRGSGAALEKNRQARQSGLEPGGGGGKTTSNLTFIIPWRPCT